MVEVRGFIHYKRSDPILTLPFILLSPLVLSRTDLNYFRLRELYTPSLRSPAANPSSSPKISASPKPIPKPNQPNDRHNNPKNHQLYIPTFKERTMA